jgi:hypothetical protein
MSVGSFSCAPPSSMLGMCMAISLLRVILQRVRSWWQDDIVSVVLFAADILQTAVAASHQPLVAGTAVGLHLGPWDQERMFVICTFDIFIGHNPLVT